MSIELVTGHAGSAHVTSAQDGRLNAAAWGDGKYVLPLQAQFAITVDSANQVTVATGDALLEGRHVTSEAPTTLAVDSGTQGMKRNDIVCIVYSKNGSGVESAALQVVKGTESSGTPSDPALPAGSILAGDTSCAMALWRLPINGITLGEPEQLYSVADLLALSENYTYSIGYTSSSRILKLTGTNGGESSQVVLPTATTTTDGLMTPSQVSMLNALRPTQVSGPAMGWGYVNASGYMWWYFPVPATGYSNVSVTGYGSVDVSCDGEHWEFSTLTGSSFRLVNGGTVLEGRFDFTGRGDLWSGHTRHALTIYASNLRATFS